MMDEKVGVERWGSEDGDIRGFHISAVRGM